MDNKKKERLEALLDQYCRQDVCVAFSGGVDSSLLLHAACKASARSGTAVYAITLDTVLHPAADLEAAKKVLEKTSAIHVVLKVDELAVPEIRFNPENRCYLCKKELYSGMLDFAEEKGIQTVMEGTNEDDLHVYRPGIQAVRELGIKSPLAECGFTKDEVRFLAGEYGVLSAERPSSPCLATRLPYGAEIRPELLKRIDQAESFLRSQGFRNVRVRVHGSITRLEVDQEDFSRVLEIRNNIIPLLKDLGFGYVTMDLEGFRSGSMDQITG